MIKVLLMYGDRLLKIEKAAVPLPFLRYGVASYISATTTADWSATNGSTDIPLFRQEMIFRLKRQVDYDAYEYQYEYTPINQKFAFSMQERIGWGLREPDEKVNLKGLKRKLRSKKKMKELLLKYYRS